MVGQTVTYTYRIENTGTITLTSISAQDNRLGPVAGIGSTLLPGEATTGTLTHVVTLADLPSPLVNTVVVTGTATGGLNVTSTGNASVTVTEAAYTLNTSVVGQGTVAKAPDQATYTYGQVVTVTATPATGWSFSEWSGACTGSGACVVTMDGDKSVTATFTQNAYTLDVTVVGSGTVAKSPDQATYTYGTEVTLTPTPATGWSFSAWSGACTVSGACVVTMDGNKSVTATFTLNTYLLTVSKTGTGSGSVTSDPSGIDCGSTCSASYDYDTPVTLSAVASPGSTFTGWSSSGCSGTGTCAVTMSEARNVTAEFMLKTYVMTINVEGGGVVTVTVTASANPGWTFAGWSGDVSGLTNPVSIPLTGTNVLTATFTHP